MEEKYHSENYQKDSPANKRLILLRRLVSKRAGFDALADPGFRTSIGIEHRKEDEYEGAESEDGTDPVSHDGQRSPNGKKGYGLQILGIVDGAQTGNYGAECGTLGRIGRQPQTFDSGSPFRSLDQTILAISLALNLVGTFDTQKLIARGTDFLRVNCRMI